MDESNGSAGSMDESSDCDDLEPLQWNIDDSTACWCQLRHPEELRQGLTELPTCKEREECVSRTHPSTGRSLIHELASRAETPETLAMLQLVLGLHWSEGRRRAVSTVCALDDRRCTPMMEAAAAGNTQALKTMLQCFSSPADDAALVESLRITDGVAGAHRHNAFHRAAEGGMATVRCLWALLAACPRTHWREFLTALSWTNGSGRSPLTLAIQADCAAAVSLLLDAAAACGPDVLEELLISAPHNGESSSSGTLPCMAVAAGRCNVPVLRLLARAFRRLAASAESNRCNERTAGAAGDSSTLGDGGGVMGSGSGSGSASGGGVEASASAKKDGGGSSSGSSSGAAERVCRWYRQAVSEARDARNRPTLLALLDSGSTDAPEALRLLLDLAPSAEEARYALAVQGPGSCTALCKAVQRLKPDKPPDGGGVPVHTAAAAASATAAATAAAATTAASQEVLEELLYRGAQLPGSCMCKASQGTRALVDVLRRNVQLARLPGACNDAIVRLVAYGTAPSRKRLRG